MKSISAEELLDLATEALEGQGFPAGVAREVAAEFVIADLAGVRTHGLGKLVSLNLGDFSAAPEVSERGAVLSVDARGGNGFVVLRAVAEFVGQRCREYGMCAAFVRNFSRYSSLYPYTDLLAREGLVGILINSAGPSAVAPFGSIDPLTGTNPICFSFPTPGRTPQTFDFATADVVWGEIRQAALEGRALPSGPFLDAAGDVTSDPASVNAVRAFGGAKGWALNLAIEILAGLLPGARAGREVESEFDCGAMLLGLDPDASGNNSVLFAEQVAGLLESVRETRPENDVGRVRAPGDRGRSRMSVSESAQSLIEVPEATVEMMQRMAAGEKIAELASNPRFN